MVYSSYKKQRMVYFYLQGHRPPTITKLLQQEGLQASRRGVAKFLKRYRETGTIDRKAGSGRPSKITAEIRALVEEQMRADDETTAVQLHAFLVREGYAISLATILRCCTSLGWTFRGSAYCQMIQEVNKQKRLDWALANQHNSFEDVIFSNECSVQLQSHRCRNLGERPKNEPRYM